DFAYSLLAKLPADKLAAKATLAAKVAVLPSASLGDGTAIGMQTGRFGGALFPTLLWLKESRSHVRLLNAKVGSLESRLTSTFQEHQAHIERVSGALQETQAQLSGAEKTNAALTAEIASRRTVVGLLKSVLRRLADR
ncbi:hypothetical protein HKX42_11710, partial [Salinisphaera sp. USBA-960]|nr:hypothetical protein [Salifodinibacter halophilus]